MPVLRVVHLFASDVSAVVAQHDDRLPVIRHWGARLDVGEDDLLALARIDDRPGLSADSDLPYVPSVLPEHGRGWFGRPGVSVHRGGRAWSPHWRAQALEVDGAPIVAGAVTAGAGSVRVVAHDDEAGLTVEWEIVLSAAGLLRTRARLRNTDDGDTPLDVIEVVPSLPLPLHADEILDFTGRWAHERAPQRHRVVRGTHARVSRRGRTGLDATTVLAVGTAGFDARSGETWLCHVGFSGDHEHGVERTDGHTAFRGGEVLLPGEVRLGPGDEYVSPWTFGAYGDGWDAASARFHAHLRESSRSSRRPRPVTLNVWEAVYFDHDIDVLTDLATQAAELGVERFVLDDGWFRGRRDDRAGLGDWEPDPLVWPEGLRPLADRVRALGMEFGLWVEPEMINEDSDLARAHPDWILRARRDELPARFRFQQVLDLTNPDAFAHILGRLDALVRENDVAYLKWDHNRDLIDAGHPATGAAAVHAQTLALYRLLDELRARHPELEIESCASGGGRVDLGILQRTDRIHPSDTHDPLDRFGILAWTGLLVPPEMMGSHVASAVSSTTGRISTLAYRCAVALLGHFGIEWDIRGLADDERATLREAIALWRRHRALIASGRVVTGIADAAAPTLRGVVGADGAEALYVVVTPATSPDAMTRLRFPGLDPRRRYRLTAHAPESLGPPWQVPTWLQGAPPDDTGDAPVLSGAVLGTVGVDFPVFHPERAAIVRAEAIA